MKNLPLVAPIIIAGIAIDQITKYIAKYLLEGQSGFSFVSDIFRLVYSENHGAFLGLGSSLPESARTLVFSGIVGVFLVSFFVYIVNHKSIEKIGVVGASLLISGGLSNLIDRLVNNGGVIDFMNVGIGSFRTGVFNIADMAILLGAFLMLWFKRSVV